MRMPSGAGASEKQGDLLLLAFNQACQSGDVKLASSLLRQLDAILLGSAMAWEQREAGLRLMRLLRDRLQVLRDEGPDEPVAGIYEPQHQVVA